MYVVGFLHKFRLRILQSTYAYIPYTKLSIILNKYFKNSEKNTLWSRKLKNEQNYSKKKYNYLQFSDNVSKVIHKTT